MSQAHAKERLVIPVLLDPLLPRNDGSIPFHPSEMTACETTSEAGASKSIALASSDNSIWIYTESPEPPIELHTPTSPLSPGSTSDHFLPSIITSPPSTAITSGNVTPTQSRPSSIRHGSFASRSRAPSSSSSILTTTTRASDLRGRGRFSPTPEQPMAAISDATAAPAEPDLHAHRNSDADRRELLDQLREQAKGDEN